MSDADNLEDIANSTPKIARRPTGSYDSLQATVKTPSNQDTQEHSQKKVTDTTKYQYQLLNQTFGGVEVKESIKIGGMSVVYRGIEVKTGQPVILKVLHPDKAGNTEARARFVQDARTTSELKHANIVETLTHGEEREIPYIVYKEIKGSKDLSDLLKPDSPVQLTPEDSANILLQVMAGLMYAHDKKVIHRDIKPGNILVGQDLHARIIDWGIARDIEQEYGFTIQGQVMGTPAYVAPEQAADPKNVTPSADVYSWACTAYEAFSRMIPQEKPTANTQSTFSNRVNTQMPFELWLNEAIELRRKDLTEEIEQEQNPENRIRLQTLLETIVPVSDELEDLIMMILNAKDPKVRPSFDLIIEKYETLTQKNKLRRHEPTPEEVKQIENERNRLKDKIKSYKIEIPQYIDPNYRNLRTFELAENLEKLAEITPRTDEERITYVREAMQYYVEAQTAFRMNPQMTDTELSGLDEKLKWITAINNNEQARKEHRETKIMEKETKERISAAYSALGKNNITELITNYSKIDFSRTPSTLMHVRDELTKQIEGLVQSLLTTGTSAIERNDLPTAKEYYERAQKISNILPDSAKTTKEQSTAFCQNLLKAEILQKEKIYKEAKTQNDYYGMFEIVEYLKAKEIPPELKEGIQQLITKADEDLKSKKLDITSLRQLIEHSKELQSDLEKELGQLGKEEVTDESIKALPEERIKYYDEELDKLSKKFTGITKESIGPKYDEFAQYLEFFKGDIRAERLKKELTNRDLKYIDKSKKISELIHHYEELGDQKQAIRYIARRHVLDSEKLKLKQ